jgi:alkanesulfonate monooxygenase SsuD/methylene tetrahydromethanopterin reductase-like flavin-dependent oxidoreductase (luciferase family)
MGVNKNYLNQVSNPTGKITFMQSIKDRVGFVVERTSAAAAIKQIVAAEEAGIRQIWMNQAYLDTLTIFAAAATKTSKVRLGTAIVQTYPRHPLALAQQVLVLNDIAPGRLRLGIGPIIEGIFGLQQRKPLVHLREYVEVLRAILWEGKVNHHGEFFNVIVTPGGLVTSLNTARLPILVSALGEKAFQLAGEIADGALSWLCPVPYLFHTGLPALRKGASITGRSASPPPLVAHVLVALTKDRNLATAAGHQFIDFYTRLPFYVKMFTSAGFPTTLGSAAPDTLVDSLVISGNEDTVTARFSELLASGLDELMVTLLPLKDTTDEQFRLMHSIAES